MISLQQITKSYRKKMIYEDVSLELPTHQITMIVGENGIGKSTLLKMIAGVEAADRGTILYDGEAWGKAERQRRIGYVPQQMALWAHMTVRDNIAFFQGLLKDAVHRDTVAQYVQLLGLDRDMNVVVDKLSGGTKRKLNLLIGLLSSPSILVLDEPTVGIDLKSRTDIQALLIALKKQMTIIMTTHLVDEMTQLPDHTILIGNDPFYAQLLEASHVSFKRI